ncbi:hypothetical protein PoB_006831400 [Plakobranchus ocellatus]|uniref:Uncharacterized protein n=1 Tax=Plakobranchus ocellatus TaxID=259542 RepID=A0AAV4DC83_9GAST|nr:hypothetical protein PoB_006831400 [Plakobranchus ocellatus]
MSPSVDQSFCSFGPTVFRAIVRLDAMRMAGAQARLVKQRVPGETTDRLDKGADDKTFRNSETDDLKVIFRNREMFGHVTSVHACAIEKQWEISSVLRGSTIEIYGRHRWCRLDQR